MYNCQLAAFAFPVQSLQEGAFQNLEIVGPIFNHSQFLKTTAYTTQVLLLPISVILFIMIMFVYIALLILAFLSMKHSMKVNFSEIQERRLKKLVCAFIDGLFWIPAFIVHTQIILGKYYINLNSGLLLIGYIKYISSYHILSVILYAVMQFSTIYYFRDYTFSRKGLYRDFSLLEIQR